MMRCGWRRRPDESARNSANTSAAMRTTRLKQSRCSPDMSLSVASPSANGNAVNRLPFVNSRSTNELLCRVSLEVASGIHDIQR